MLRIDFGFFSVSGVWRAVPVVMPLVSSLDIAGDDNLVIETVVAESADVEPEGISRLKSRVPSLPNLPWFAKLCYVTDTLSYSDNCEDEYASPKNFAIRIADLDTRNSFILTRYWDAADHRCDTALVGVAVSVADCTVTGTEGDDILNGTADNDVICGLGGNDKIDGRSGDDSLEGNQGSDKIHGGRGDDIIWGDQGDDIIRGNAGKDTITPGAGEDTILGTTLDDTIY